MINRILIRIKVVQMLYSYLLTRTDFKIAGRPDEADISADRRFAYEVYVDLLLLLLEITGNDTHSSPGSVPTVVTDKKMAKSRLGAALAADSTVRSLIAAGNSDIDALRPVAQALHDAVTASEVWKDFSRRRTAGLAEEVAMWLTAIPTVIAKNSELDKVLRDLPGYTGVGYKTGIAMLSDTLQSYNDTRAAYLKAKNDLQDSLDKAYELYVSIFALITELTREQERRIENAKYKHLATAEERNPNTRFINNALAAKIMQSPDIDKFCRDNKISWETDIALVNSLLEAITASAPYKEYMEAPATDYAADCEFWRTVLRTVVFNNDDFNEALEDKSVYWNDDLQIMGTFVLKTIRQVQNDESEPIALLPRYKDEEDAAFGAELFDDTVRNRETYRSYIDRFVNTGNWDPDRLAFMDIVIMMTAISELVNYPKIPLPVTMNEYIEIANSYSTAKSGQFVNGILFNVINQLRSEGKLCK